MHDAIQQQLHRAWAEGDRAAQAAACDALCKEWRPRIRRFLASPSTEEVEDALQDAILALVLSASGGAPKALASAEVARPQAWRRRVLQNHLCSAGRYTGRRRHAESAQAQALSPSAEKREWARRKQERERQASTLGDARRQLLSDPIDRQHAPTLRGDGGDTEAQLDLEARRRDLWPLLPELAIQRLVIVALALRFDPSPFAEELARKRTEPVAEVLHRIGDALAAAVAGKEEPPTEAAAAVVWPDGDLAKAREIARKAQ